MTSYEYRKRGIYEDIIDNTGVFNVQKKTMERRIFIFKTKKERMRIMKMMKENPMKENAPKNPETITRQKA